MGKESVEGYEGGNWPAKTGNPSGKGRGNAQPSGVWDDDFDDSDVGGSSVPLTSQVAERNRSLMEASLPPLPLSAEEIECTVHRSRVRPDSWELELVEHPEQVFKFHPALIRYHIENSNWSLLTMHLVGDQVKLVVHRDRLNRCVYRIKNLTIDEYRLHKESEHRFPSGHQMENQLRSGQLGCEPFQRDLLFNHRHDKGQPRWFVKSGDFTCWHLAFASLQLASYWMDTLSNNLHWRDGPAFCLSSGLFKCSIVDKHGNPPRNWDIPPDRYHRDYHEHLRHRG